jgi:alkanesulfonate monooxygenase SsuD/methylene tetrahydromethanopterin reductase-like flavin-dependent oxidoreductase (luciferase family)
MEIGVGLDASLGLSFEEEAVLSRAAAELGYTSLWTPEGAGYDSFQVCAQRWTASRDVVPEGLTTGISVSPVALRTPMGLAMSAGTVSAITGGRFILGIGSGGIYRPSGRRSYGLPKVSSLEVMRDYLVTVRALVAGEAVTYEGQSVNLHEVKLGIRPAPSTPVYLGALGPKMLRLSGESADGAALNWCTPEQIAWSRERIAEGAETAGRDPAVVKMAEYIRVCVDEDTDAARCAFAKATLGYAMGPKGATATGRALGYRAHFERMGFADTLSRLDGMRDRGASADEMVDAFPVEQLDQVGYQGPASGAAEAFGRLSKGLDTAIVRVVAAKPGVEHVLATMNACRPELVGV